MPLCQLLADAFLIAPVGDWLIPDLAARRDVYVKYFGIFLGHGLSYGVVDVNVDLSGVAIWFPHDADSPNPADVYHHYLAWRSS
jgi:hypothetical protein